MTRPDRIPVLDSFGVVPHPIAVDHRRAGVLRDSDHEAVDVGGDAGEHVLRGAAESLWPARPDEFLVAADPAGGHYHRGRGELERADDLS